MTAEEKEKYYSNLFMSIVFNFQSAALQQMGKIKNPATNKIERDMEQAKLSIDVIDMLSVKTGNNLSENESKYIEHVAKDLKMIYIVEINKDKQKTGEQSPADKTD